MPRSDGSLCESCVMDPQTQAVRLWTLTETHTLLDLIRDMGVIRFLTQKGSQNSEVFGRLSELLGRCNIRVSSAEVKSHWQDLKLKFMSLKHLLVLGLVRVSGVSVDFPFYEDMEQLLNPLGNNRSCMREADSSGMPGDVMISSATIQRLERMLHDTSQQLMEVMERLQRVSTVQEQLSIQMGYMCSAAVQITHQPYHVPPDSNVSQNTTHNMVKASSGPPLLE
ncbi:uncharacterized protein LOC143801748 isoform X3 [Ranitomeya variabilis]|uniref:uncharacterized protein LOC143801748 isoform X3 n=1 Tax=Ranitomeya variabilis TaxID=490064 RepID=UPI004056AA8F